MTTNYLGLAIKYRPKNFSSLRAQDNMVKTISNAILYERVANAFMLTGIRGVGKTTTARIIAKTINCSSVEYRDNVALACGNCQSCVAFAKHSHPDVIEIDAASHNGIADIRDIIENASYSPVLANYKIYIIDEVHMLSNSAFNALLKTLEEPPEHAKFIFATTEINKVPPTIMSRCQKYDLARFSKSQIMELMQFVAGSEKINISDAACQLLASASEGSARDALSLLDKAITLESMNNSNEKNGAANNETSSIIKIEEFTILNMLGVADTGLVFSLLDFILNNDVPKALEICEKLHDNGKNLFKVFQSLLSLLAEIMKLKHLPKYIPDYIDQHRNFLKQQASSLNIENLIVLWQLINKILPELKFAEDQHMHAQVAIIRLANATSLPNLAELGDQIANACENLKPVAQDLESLNNIVQKTTPDEKKAKYISKLPKNKTEMVDLLYEHGHIQLYNFISHSVKEVEFCEGEICVLHVEKSSVSDDMAAEEAANLKSLSNFLQENFASKYQVNIKIFSSDKLKSDFVQKKTQKNFQESHENNIKKHEDANSQLNQKPVSKLQEVADLELTFPGTKIEE